MAPKVAAPSPCHDSVVVRLCGKTVVPRRAVLLAVAWAAACSMAGATPGVMSFEVHGKVQGVFFRKHTQATAAKLGLRGWCENTPSGTVRGEAHGQEAALEKFKHWLRHTGSPKSKISSADFGTVSKDPATLQMPFKIKK